MSQDASFWRCFSTCGCRSSGCFRTKLRILALLLPSFARLRAEPRLPGADACRHANVPELMRDLAGRILPVYRGQGQPESLSRQRHLRAPLQIVAGSNYTAAGERSRQSPAPRRGRRLLPGRRRQPAESSGQMHLLISMRVPRRAHWRRRGGTSAVRRRPSPQAFHETVADGSSDRDAYAVTRLARHQPPCRRRPRVPCRSWFDRTRASDASTVSEDRGDRADLDLPGATRPIAAGTLRLPWSAPLARRGRARAATSAEERRADQDSGWRRRSTSASCWCGPKSIDQSAPGAA